MVDKNDDEVLVVKKKNKICLVLDVKRLAWQEEIVGLSLKIFLNGKALLTCGSQCGDSHFLVW